MMCNNVDVCTENKQVDHRIGYERGKRVFNREDGGPNFAEINKALDRLVEIHWAQPAKDLDFTVINRYVREHLDCLEKHSKEVFSEVLTKFIKTREEFDSLVGSHYSDSYLAGLDGAYSVSRNADNDKMYGEVFDEAYIRAKKGHDFYSKTKDATRMAPWSVAWLVSNQPYNPYAPLVEIIALGCVPLGLVGGEFLVWVPEVG
jgi:hypothetical protein